MPQDGNCGFHSEALTLGLTETPSLVVLNPDLDVTVYGLVHAPGAIVSGLTGVAVPGAGRWPQPSAMVHLGKRQNSGLTTHTPNVVGGKQGHGYSSSSSSAFPSSFSSFSEIKG